MAGKPLNRLEDVRNAVAGPGDHADVLRRRIARTRGRAGADAPAADVLVTGRDLPQKVERLVVAAAVATDRVVVHAAGTELHVRNRRLNTRDDHVDQTVDQVGALALHRPGHVDEEEDVRDLDVGAEAQGAVLLVTEVGKDDEEVGVRNAARGIGGVGHAPADLDHVGDAVAVRVLLQRVGPQHHLFVIGQAVVVRIGVDEVGGAVHVGVGGRAGVACAGLFRVGDPVAIRVVILEAGDAVPVRVSIGFHRVGDPVAVGVGQITGDGSGIRPSVTSPHAAGARAARHREGDGEGGN